MQSLSYANFLHFFSRNMDGTALYEAVAAIYISQSLNMTLSFGQVILVRYEVIVNFRGDT